METNYLIYGAVAVVIIIIALYFMMSCKANQVKIDGKCYDMLLQKDPVSTIAVTDLAKLIDSDMTTAAGMTTSTVSLTLASKDAKPMAKLQGARIVAMVKAATPATTDKVNLTLKSGDKSLPFEFPQDGKVLTVGKLFPAPLTDVSSLTLEVPANVTLYEVQLI